jgi:hypothetical protein
MTDIDWQVVGRKGKISKRLGGSASKTTADRGCYPPACSFKDEAGGSIDQLKTAHKNLKPPLPGWSYCPSRDVGRLNTAGQKRLNSQTFSDAEEADSEVAMVVPCENMPDHAESCRIERLSELANGKRDDACHDIQCNIKFPRGIRGARNSFSETAVLS